MFDSLLNKYVFNYWCMMEYIYFIDDNSYFCESMNMFGTKGYVTDFIKGNTDNIYNDSDINRPGVAHGNVFYTKNSGTNLYKYNVTNKVHDIIVDIGTNDVVIYNNKLLKSLAKNDVSEIDSQGVVQTIYNSRIDARQFRPFKKGVLIYNTFDFEYKESYIMLNSREGFDITKFVAGKWDVNGDYLVVGCTKYTKNNIQPKLKVLTTNKKDTEWIIISELVSDYFIELIRVKNDLIYLIDTDFVLRILDLNCKEIKCIPLEKQILCFDVSPNGKKLAYAYSHYVRVIDLE